MGWDMLQPRIEKFMNKCWEKKTTELCPILEGIEELVEPVGKLELSISRA